MNSNIKRSLFYFYLIFFFGKVLIFFFYNTCTRHTKYRLLLVLLMGLYGKKYFIVCFIVWYEELGKYNLFLFCFVSALIWYSIYYNPLWGQVWSCIYGSMYSVILTLIRNAFTTFSILWFFFCEEGNAYNFPFLYLHHYKSVVMWWSECLSPRLT